MLEHGGRLHQAAVQFGIPLADWLDLSTGINPSAWPVPSIPARCWQRLPEEEDGLLDAAGEYYGNPSLLAVAGSQAAIQRLPHLRHDSRVGVISPAYAEHAAAWEKAGHNLIRLAASAEAINGGLAELDVLILINPNNPSGVFWSRQQLLNWHARLAQRGGWLIVDEAFIDSQSEFSLADIPVQTGLIVLRSLGKFFGMAGVRCGFVIAEADLLRRLAEQLGPWTLSHPSRYAATLALSDKAWQAAMTERLRQQGQRLRQLLTIAGWTPTGGCDLFQWIKSPQAQGLHLLLAEQGILTRQFTDPASIRFGLPGDETDWQRLAAALFLPAVSALAN